MDKIKQIFSSDSKDESSTRNSGIVGSGEGSHFNNTSNKKETMPGSFVDDTAATSSTQPTSASTTTGTSSAVPASNTSGLSATTDLGAKSTSSHQIASAAPQIPAQDFGDGPGTKGVTAALGSTSSTVNQSLSGQGHSSTAGSDLASRSSASQPYDKLNSGTPSGISQKDQTHAHPGLASGSDLHSNKDTGYASTSGTGYDGSNSDTLGNTAGGMSVGGAGIAGAGYSMGRATNVSGNTATLPDRSVQSGASAAGSSATINPTTTERSFPLGGEHIQGPHSTATANVLDPRYEGAASDRTANSLGLPVPAVVGKEHDHSLDNYGASRTHQNVTDTTLHPTRSDMNTEASPNAASTSQHDTTSSGTHTGRDAALVGGGVGTGVVGGEVLQHGLHQHSDAQGTSANPMAAHEPHSTSGTTGHAGRDAALVGGGAGAGAVTGAGLAREKHDPHVSRDSTHSSRSGPEKHEKEGMGKKIKSALGLGSTKDKEHGHAGNTLDENERHKTDSSAYPPGRDAALKNDHDHPEKHHSGRDAQKSHHNGRDAAVVAGTGAGVGTVANEWRGPKGTDAAIDPNYTGPASKTLGPHDSNIKNIMDPSVRPEPGMMKDHTTVGPHQSDTINKMDPRVQHDPAKAAQMEGTGHYPRDAAVAGGAGALGASAVGHEATRGTGMTGNTSTSTGAKTTDRYDQLASGTPSGVSRSNNSSAATTIPGTNQSPSSNNNLDNRETGIVGTSGNTGSSGVGGGDRYDHISSTGTPSGISQNDPTHPHSSGTTGHGSSGTSMGTDAREHNVATTEEKRGGLGGLLHRDNPNKLHKDPPGTESETHARTTHEAQNVVHRQHMGTDGQIGQM